MTKTISLILTLAFLSLGTVSFTSCSNLGGVSGTISSAQAWLNDPANQAMINNIASTAISLIGMFGKRAETTKATVTGKLAEQFPNVPAGAIAQIAKNPNAYLKK